MPEREAHWSPVPTSPIQASVPVLRLSDVSERPRDVGDLSGLLLGGMIGTPSRI